MGEVHSEADQMEQRLRAWAAWLGGARQSQGYPVTNVLHLSWMPPARGSVPVKLGRQHSDAREREMHRRIQALSVRLINTLVVVYVQRGTEKDQAVRLDCQPSTVRARVAEAKRLLALMP